MFDRELLKDAFDDQREGYLLSPLTRLVNQHRLELLKQ